MDITAFSETCECITLVGIVESLPPLARTPVVATFHASRHLLHLTILCLSLLGCVAALSLAACWIFLFSVQARLLLLSSRLLSSAYGVPAREEKTGKVDGNFDGKAKRKHERGQTDEQKLALTLKDHHVRESDRLFGAPAGHEDVTADHNDVKARASKGEVQDPGGPTASDHVDLDCTENRDRQTKGGRSWGPSDAYTTIVAERHSGNVSTGSPFGGSKGPSEAPSPPVHIDSIVHTTKLAHSTEASTDPTVGAREDSGGEDGTASWPPYRHARSAEGDYRMPGLTVAPAPDLTSCIDGSLVEHDGSAPSKASIHDDPGATSENDAPHLRFSAEQLAEAASFAKDATKGGQKGRPNTASGIQSQRASPIPQRRTRRNQHASSVKGAIGLTALQQLTPKCPMTAATLKNLRGASGSGARFQHLYSKSDDCNLPPHLRKAQEAKGRRKSVDEGPQVTSLGRSSQQIEPGSEAWASDEGEKTITNDATTYEGVESQVVEQASNNAEVGFDLCTHNPEHLFSMPQEPDDQDAVSKGNNNDTLSTSDLEAVTEPATRQKVLEAVASVANHQADYKRQSLDLQNRQHEQGYLGAAELMQSTHALVGYHHPDLFGLDFSPETVTSPVLSLQQTSLHPHPGDNSCRTSSSRVVLGSRRRSSQELINAPEDDTATAVYVDELEDDHACEIFAERDRMDRTLSINGSAMQSFPYSASWLASKPKYESQDVYEADTTAHSIKSPLKLTRASNKTASRGRLSKRERSNAQFLEMLGTGPLERRDPKQVVSNLSEIHLAQVASSTADQILDLHDKPAKLSYDNLDLGSPYNESLTLSSASLDHLNQDDADDRVDVDDTINHDEAPNGSPNVKGTLKRRKRAAREALCTAWIARERARKMTMGTSSLENMLALDAATDAYNTKRKDLAELSNGGELTAEDVKHFPHFAKGDLAVPKHPPPNSQRMRKASHDGPEPSTPAVGEVAEPAMDINDLRKIALIAKERYEEAVMYMRTPKPRGRKDHKTLNAEGRLRMERATKYYRKKREALEEAFPEDEWLKSRLPAV